MSWMLPRLVGVTRAADLLLSGRVVTGAETADWGLWNERPRRRRGDARRGARATPDLLATTVGPDAVTTTKRQLYDDLLPPRRRRRRSSDSKRLLDEAMAHGRVPRGGRRASATDDHRDFDQ